MMAAQLEATAADIHAHRILILDFGAQYTQLIARRVREIGVYCEIMPWDVDEEAIRRFGARGIILSGGPESVTDASPPRAPTLVFTQGEPVLGIIVEVQLQTTGEKRFTWPVYVAALRARLEGERAA